MENKKKTKNFDIENVLDDFYKIESPNKGHGMQYSFVSKMAHTLNNNMPIYDTNIAEVFGFPRPKNNNQEKNKVQFLHQYNDIQEIYKLIIDNNLLDNVIDQFYSIYKKTNLPKIKVLDFIFWGLGRIKIKIKIELKKEKSKTTNKTNKKQKK